MNPTIEQIKAYVMEQHPNFGEYDAKSLIEMLYYCYEHYNPVKTEEIEKHFADLEDVFEALPFDQSNALFSTMCELCCLHQREAFFQGFHVGVRLVTELSEG